jgi:hypothetical protein
MRSSGTYGARVCVPLKQTVRNEPPGAPLECRECAAVPRLTPVPALPPGTRAVAESLQPRALLCGSAQSGIFHKEESFWDSSKLGRPNVADKVLLPTVLTML